MSMHFMKGMIDVHDTMNGPLVVGTKQTLKALEDQEVLTLYIANDADEEIKNQAIQLANSRRVPIVYYNTMEELGKACKIRVGTATAALIKQ